MFDLKIFQISRHGKSGFTLLEILASMALLAVITLGVTTTLQHTTELNQRVNTRQASLFSGQIAIDRLRRELRMAFSEDVQGSDTTFYLREGSNGAELLFSYIESPVKRLFIRRTPGVKSAFYKLEKADDGTFDLLRREAPVGDRESLQRQDEFQLLARGILVFEVQAYDARNDRWRNDWDDRGRLTGGYFPRAVRLYIESVDPELPQEEWPDRSLAFQTEVLLLNQMDES